MTAPTFVLFDLGNVVVDWEPQRLYRKRFGDAAKADWFFENICTMAWHTRHDRGESFSVTIPELQAQHPDYADDIVAWRDEWLEMFHGYVPGVPLLMAQLEAAKVPLFGLSNMSSETMGITADAFPMIKVLRDVVVSGDEGMVKPDPRIYDLTLARMGNPDPARVLFIDDREENIAAARAKGMQGHVFDGAAGLEARLVHEGLL